MAKRMAVGPKYRRGLLLTENGEAKWFGPGEIIPEDEQAKIPGRFLRDKRVIFVDVEDEPVKKARPKATPKTKKENADKSASPSPSSEGAGASAPAPLEVTGEKSEKSAETKPKRKRKKLFSSD